MPRISRSRAQSLIETSAGRILTVTFIKKDGSSRTVNGMCKKDSVTKLGYIRMFSIQDKGYRSIDPRTMTTLKLNKQVYNVK